MVHALEEIRRVLVPAGLLIDLRPVADRWPVEVASDSLNHSIGHVTDLPSGLADDEAANQAILESARKGWFIRESEQNFPFFSYWDTPDEMRKHIQEKWEDSMQLEVDVYRKVQAVWKASGAGFRVRVKAKMLLTLWRKT